MRATFIAIIAAAVGFFVLAVSSVYIVDEGHVGVVTKWGKAVAQEDPSGIQFRNPISTDILEFDVRERRLGETMAAATANQLPITAEVTASWRMDPTRVLEIYTKYGGPERFESTIMAPRMRQASKAGIAVFQASDLIKDRTTSAAEIMTNLTEALENYPIILESLQIEQVVLPPRYLEAVMLKEEAREAAQQEKYTLEKQNLQAKQGVQTANAERDATIARADGEAYRVEKEAEARAKAILAEGKAQANAIKEMQAALANNPLVIDYEKARRWNGQMPSTVLGDDTNMLMSLR